MTDQENKALYIAEQLRRYGFTLAGAAGVIANIEAESAFKSNNLQDVYESRLGMNDETYTSRVDNNSYLGFVDDSAGYGLCQWTASDRKDGMLKFHRSRGRSIGDFATQIDWLLTEIKSYSLAYNICMNSNDPFECGYTVCKYYEIPANTENQALYRGGVAQKWYNWLVQNANTESTFSEATEGPKEPNVNGGATDIPPAIFWPPRGYRGGQEDPGLCLGMAGPDVEFLCSILKLRGYHIHFIDSKFTETVNGAVREFQQKNGLSVDGIVGYNTWRSLLKM